MIKPSNLPKISIIIPSYNQVDYIEETILSVINQDYPYLQIIVIDGGSTDGTIDILKKYENFFDFWISEKDNGQSNAINKGFKKADGDIVTWLCSDDTYLNDSLKTVGDFFMKNSKIDFLYGNVISIDENSNIINKIRNLPFSKLGFFCVVASIPQPASFYRKKLLDKCGLLNEQLHFFMDYDLFSRMLIAGAKFKSIKNLLATYRYHNKSKTVNSQKDINNHIRIRNQVLRKYIKKLKYSSKQIYFATIFYKILRCLINIDRYLLRSLNLFK